MNFLPEITSRVKAFIGREGGPIQLNLKSNVVSPELWSLYRNGFPNTAAAGFDNGRYGSTAALNLSTVWACRRAICEPVAFLPLSLMQRKGGATQTATWHPAYALLHDAPNEEMSAMSFRESRTSKTLLQGDGFAQIIRRSGTEEAIELQPLQTENVARDRDKQGRLTYIIKQKNGPDVTFTVQNGKPHDILHIKGIGDDGVHGQSVLSFARQSIGTGLSGERHVARFYDNGGRLPYLLKVNQKFSNNQDRDKFRKDWEEVASQPHKTPILEPWLEYEKTGISMQDAQMLESRQFSVADICRWFNVSPHLAGDLSHATFSNVEQLALDHVKFCLNAWFRRWEAELWRCVLTPQERAAGYFFKHNVNALLRGDFVSRMAGYASALQNGHLNQDEVRDYEDLNPLPNGEGSGYHIQLNMQTLPAAGGALQVQQDPAAAHLASESAKQRSNSNE